MDEMLPKESSSIRDDERQKERFRKLCEQYRGKYQRLDSIRDLREKSIAVLHFSAGIFIRLTRFSSMISLREWIQYGYK